MMGAMTKTYTVEMACHGEKTSDRLFRTARVTIEARRDHHGDLEYHPLGVEWVGHPPEGEAFDGRAVALALNIARKDLLT